MPARDGNKSIDVETEMKKRERIVTDKNLYSEQHLSISIHIESVDFKIQR